MEQTENKGLIFKIKRFSVHDGPGIRTAVFLKGCPLSCVWCHSPEGISHEITVWHNNNLCIACGQCVEACPSDALAMNADSESKILIDRGLCKNSGLCVSTCPANAIQFTGSVASADDVIREVEKDILFYEYSGGGVTLTGGEPLYQPAFAASILRACRDRNIHTAVETSLFCEREVLETISDLIDLFIIDLKIFDSDKHIEFTGKPNEQILDNFALLASYRKNIIVRIPLISKITDTENNLNAITGFVKKTGVNIPVEMISYNPLAGNNYRKLDIPFIMDDK